MWEQTEGTKDSFAEGVLEERPISREPRADPGHTRKTVFLRWRGNALVVGDRDVCASWHRLLTQTGWMSGSGWMDRWMDGWTDCSQLLFQIICFPPILILYRSPQIVGISCHFPDFPAYFPLFCTPDLHFFFQTYVY